MDTTSWRKAFLFQLMISEGQCARTRKAWNRHISGHWNMWSFMAYSHGIGQEAEMASMSHGLV